MSFKEQIFNFDEVQYAIFFFYDLFFVYSILEIFTYPKIMKIFS